MTHSPVPSHATQLTKTFAGGGFIGIVAVVSAIALATLVYVWFFT